MFMEIFGVTFEMQKIDNTVIEKQQDIYHSQIGDLSGACMTSFFNTDELKCQRLDIVGYGLILLSGRNS